MPTTTRGRLFRTFPLCPPCATVSPRASNLFLRACIRSCQIPALLPSPLLCLCRSEKPKPQMQDPRRRPPCVGIHSVCDGFCWFVGLVFLLWGQFLGSRFISYSLPKRSDSMCGLFWPSPLVFLKFESWTSGAKICRGRLLFVFLRMPRRLFSTPCYSPVPPQAGLVRVTVVLFPSAAELCLLLLRADRLSPFPSEIYSLFRSLDVQFPSLFFPSSLGQANSTPPVARTELGL